MHAGASVDARAFELPSAVFYSRRNVTRLARDGYRLVRTAQRLGYRAAESGRAIFLHVLEAEHRCSD